MRLVLAAGVAVAGVALTACSGSSVLPRPAAPGQHGHPNLAAFLAQPIASPASCPPSVNGTTVGRRSPWVGTVDVSVFLARSDNATVVALHQALVALPGVTAVFYESVAQAYAEFQRLYTCSAGVPQTSVPASYRIVLAAMPLQDRDGLVRRILRLPGVATASCDPSSPCVDAVASPSPSGSS